MLSFVTTQLLTQQQVCHPFFIAYGQEARIPVEAVTGRLNLSECHPLDDPDQKAETLAEQLAFTRRAAHDNYLKAQNKRQPIIDANRTHVEFQEGEEVLVYQNQSKISSGGKFRPRYTGPWVIIKKLSPNTYLVTIDEKRGKGRRYENDIVNVNRIKRFHERVRPPEQASTPCTPRVSIGNDEHTNEIIEDQGVPPVCSENVGSEPSDSPTVYPPRAPPLPTTRPRRVTRPPKRFGDYNIYRIFS